MPPRIPSLETPPLHPGTPNYTLYAPQPAEWVRRDVLDASANGSFISTCLRVITRNGQSKNFETLSGQDGLTFGITDFATDGGVAEFMQRVNQHFPDEFAAAFADHAHDLLSLAWIKQNNAGGKGAAANDQGLIRFPWLRQGLDRILTDPHIRGVQLANFRHGKIDPSFEAFQHRGFKLQFTLGCMIGLANSLGAGGMRSALQQAIEHQADLGDSGELAVARRLLQHYVETDPHPGPKDGELLARGFVAGAELSEDGLGHRGRRAYALFKAFPLAAPFQELGEFSLADEGPLPPDG
ncbi:hypothetical protein [Pseudomonas sp. 273]|uniref:hypothetical protein n=1 Tax=Pseudomonas sp. 273 TaxID=75692 RepID=UPI0023D7F884|nr:hypothetical protein [Pseudomonas sp. 273]